MKMKLKEIVFDKKYLPRMRIHRGTIQRYKDAYEIGEELPPLVVQKKKKILIDGFHRYEALKELKVEEVEVELLDIPEDQIYIEAVRRVSEHGLPPNDDDVGLQIYNLRVVHKLTLKEIGELVKKHESTISKRISADPRFKNLSAQDTEGIDGRTKYYNSKEIINRLDRGQTGVEIAEDLGISEATVSNVKKEEEKLQQLRDKSPILVTLTGESFTNIFNLVSLKGKTNIMLNFQEDALYVNNEGSDRYVVYGRFPKEYFNTYSVGDPIAWHINSKNLSPMFSEKSVINAKYIEIILISGKLELKFRGGGGEASYSPDPIGLDVLPLENNFQFFDESGRMIVDEENYVNIKGSPRLVKIFRGMPGPDDKSRMVLEFKDGELRVRGEYRDWRFERDIPLKEEYEGGDVQIRVGNDIFKTAISSQDRAWNFIIVSGKRNYILANIFEEVSGYYVNHLLAGSNPEGEIE